MSVVSELMQETATLADTPAVIPFAFQNVPEGKNPGEAISIKPGLRVKYVPAGCYNTL